MERECVSAFFVTENSDKRDNMDTIHMCEDLEKTDLFDSQYDQDLYETCVTYESLFNAEYDNDLYEICSMAEANSIQSSSHSVQMGQGVFKRGVESDNSNSDVKIPQYEGASTSSDKAPIDSKKPIVWVLGGPGSGKGTQCEKIIAKYGFTHLSTGDLLRAEVKSGSDRAKCLTAIMERGELVPNDVVLELLKEAMVAQADTSKGFLIDGYPREKSQGVAFENTIAPVTVIIYFEASSETLTKRLLGRAASSGRADDNEETIKLRLKTFIENNEAVLAQYPEKLRRINAERTVEEIFAEVQAILDPVVANAAN